MKKILIILLCILLLSIMVAVVASPSKLLSGYSAEALFGEETDDTSNRPYKIPFETEYGGFDTEGEHESTLSTDSYTEWYTETSTEWDTEPYTEELRNFGEYSDHVLLERKNMGGCKTLIGNVVVSAVFVKDNDSSWDTDSMNAQSDLLEAALKQLSLTAESYGYDLSLSAEYYFAITNTSGRIEDGSDFARKALESANLPELHSVNLELKDMYGCDEAPVIFFLNKDGRSYAVNSTASYEFAICYTTEYSTIMHELLHIFGACDLYTPQAVNELAKNYYPDSIMINSTNGEIDELTAYSVGWLDDLSVSSKEFLDKTVYLTEDDINEGYEHNTYTGYVTDYRINDTYYTGYLNYGQFDGYGTAVYDDGNKYVGDWDFNVKDGTGTIYFRDGDVYSGEWKDDKRNGQGSYTWASGDAYTGDWQDNKRHGQGTFTWVSGDTYVGEYRDDMQNGIGTYTWASGSKYVGEWKNGIRDGYGEYYDSNGNLVHAGIYENDEFVG